MWEDLGISTMVETSEGVDFVFAQSTLSYKCANGKIGISPNGKEVAYGYLTCG